MTPVSVRSADLPLRLVRRLFVRVPGCTEVQVRIRVGGRVRRGGFVRRFVHPAVRGRRTGRWCIRRLGVCRAVQRRTG